MEQDTLYCYKLTNNGDKIDLIRYTIPEWKPIKGYSRIEYNFNGKYIHSIYKHEYTKSTQLDRVVNNKLFTFNSDYNYAYKVITKDLKSRKAKAANDYKKCKSNLQMWVDYLKQKGREDQ